ncbi:YAP-binding/ALF4/Glomulin [Leptodontidium sp. 2 PMI_412]|nr:YAP-binding/ALF4/Glomulin [Leptodontidium sp. MPI-SDFR-AT-0119]KAH9212105.1 YAP-binding/ALF4/Glomulin [Leptodontidium sp. 2 PMI_412]
MADYTIKAITESLPPVTDPITYLTILETHMSPEILPTLNDLLQDAELSQSIGWDLIQLLLPMPGSQKCLDTIARLGNPREVVLKVTESMQLLDLDEDEGDNGDGEEKEEHKKDGAVPSSTDKFCTLVNLLATLHPRIKTKNPSRFLSTSLMAILSSFRPSNEATLAVISFVHTVSGKKRPSLPGRKSSLNIPTAASTSSGPSAPDPEAQDEDPSEAAIQQKLLQSFVTHVLEEYINTNTLEWAARLQEQFAPGMVVPVRTSLAESYKEDPVLVTRTAIVGHLVALSRDLGLSDFTTLFDAIYRTDSHPAEYETEYPSSPGEIPLSQAGSLFLITSFVFSSILSESKISQPKLTIFPDHAKLIQHFIGISGPASIGSEETGVIDAVLALGLWLENNNNFVAGPLEDEDFLQHLQSISLLSANTPSATLRYAAHVLTSSILHAHPVDRLRLTFISDTLEHCPYESLKGSAVSWLKEEIITARTRKADNVFASSVALAAAQPYLFPDTSPLADASNEELLQELEQSFPFHMAVVNFLYFISGKTFSHLVPAGMMGVVEEIYLGPLRTAQEKGLEILNPSPESLAHVGGSKMDLQLLGDRIAICSTQIEEK